MADARWWDLLGPSLRGTIDSATNPAPKRRRLKWWARAFVWWCDRRRLYAPLWLEGLVTGRCNLYHDEEAP